MANCKHRWYLINNNNHTSMRFSSGEKLKEYAKEHGLTIKHSYTDTDCYYTESYQYIPAHETLD